MQNEDTPGFTYLIIGKSNLPSRSSSQVTSFRVHSRHIRCSPERL